MAEVYVDNVIECSRHRKKAAAWQKSKLWETAKESGGKDFADFGNT